MSTFAQNCECSLQLKFATVVVWNLCCCVLGLKRNLELLT